MLNDLQRMIDTVFGDCALMPDHPQEPTPRAVERQKAFDRDMSKLARLRDARLRAEGR